MIVNLTPHEITVDDVSFPPAATPARCEEITSSAGYFDSLPLVTKRYGQVVNLPDPYPNTMYIVSMMVRQACPGRPDLASPGDLIRDENGRILGAKNLVVNFPVPF